MMTELTNQSLDSICSTLKERLFNTIDLYLERVISLELKQAMQYTVTASGKCFRSLLVYGTGLALRSDVKELDAPAAALELIHTYSLIHDDLPCMDNASLR